MTPAYDRAKTHLLYQGFPLALLLTLVLVGGLNTAHGADPEVQTAETAWAHAQSETDPARRRAADLRAARAGSLPAMERLLVTGRFREIALIDIRQPPFPSWATLEPTGDATLTPKQIHGLVLANWAFRNSFLLVNQGTDLMTQARAEMASGTPSHPLLAMELAWHLHSYEPKDPTAARRWFDQAKAGHVADTTTDRWLHFCQAVDLATVAVSNGYADVAFQLTEQVEKDAAGFDAPYATGMAKLVRAYLQQSAWTGKPDPTGAHTAAKLAAEAFAQSDAPVMRAYALSLQAAACFALAETHPERRHEAALALGECVKIYEQLGARTWQAWSLIYHSQSVDLDTAIVDLRLAVRLMTDAKEDCGRASASMWLMQVLAYYMPAEHRDEVVSLADWLLPRMTALGMSHFRPRVQEWRSSVIESRRAIKGD